MNRRDRMSKNRITTPIVISALLLSTACSGNTVKHSTDTLSLNNCAIQETIPGAKATGAFLTINKSDDSALSLVSAKAPTVTNHVEIHEMKMKDGTMVMQQIKEYPLKKGANIFKKGGYHIMLMDMKKSIKVGEKHKLALSFSDGTSKSCIATVKSVKELTPKGMKHMKHMKPMKPMKKDMKHMKS